MTKPASKPASSEQGLSGWFRRLFSGAAEPTRVTGDPSRRPRPPQLNVPVALSSAQNDNSDVDPAWLAHAPAFAAHAAALALPYAEPVVFSAAQQAQIEQLAELVLSDAAVFAGEPTALPTASLRILQLVARADLEFAELVAAVQQDPALTAAVLRVANSAAMGASNGSMQTVRDAVTRLGVAESGSVVGVVATQALFNPQSKAAQRLFGPLLNELHVASSSAASGAAQLSMERGLGRSDLAYLGGMLHDVGKSLAIASVARLIQAGKAPAELDPAVLEGLLERVHVELGSQAHVRWELPQYLADLCANHHSASCPLNQDTRELHLVRIASGLIALRLRAQPSERIGELVDSLSALSITAVRTRAIDAGLRSRGLQVRQVLAT